MSFQWSIIEGEFVARQPLRTDILYRACKGLQNRPRLVHNHNPQDVWNGDDVYRSFPSFNPVGATRWVALVMMPLDIAFWAPNVSRVTRPPPVPRTGDCQWHCAMVIMAVVSLWGDPPGRPYIPPLQGEVRWGWVFVLPLTAYTTHFHSGPP